MQVFIYIWEKNLKVLRKVKVFVLGSGEYGGFSCSKYSIEEEV